MTGDESPTAGDFTFDGATDAGSDEASSDDDGVPVPGPTPGVGPAAVVRAQLDAIEAASVSAAANASDDVPAVVRTLFDHAAPEYRTAHGSLSGFAATLLGPMFDRLVGAEAVERGPGERDGDRYRQSVLARHPDGDRTYEFVLERQVSGKYDDCWMTTRVDLVYDGPSPSFRRTPTVTFGDREVTCEVGDQLRGVLLAADGDSPHNDVTQVANCGGNGLCGTCAVECDGEVDEMGPREERRLELPPHEAESGLRLSCQTHVQGDVTVRKHDGLWGQHVAEVADGPGDAVADAVADEHDDGDAADPVPVTEAEYDGTYEYAAASAGGAGR